MIIENLQDFIKQTEKGRLIALDVGTKTIGLAITDDTQSIITPVDTIYRKGNKKDIPILLNIFQGKKVKGIIIGLPLSFDNKDTNCSTFIKRFTNNLSLETDLPIFFQDERLSSFEAEDLMLDKVGFNKTKKVVDKIASSYILESFLNNKI